MISIERKIALREVMAKYTSGEKLTPADVEKVRLAIITPIAEALILDLCEGQTQCSKCGHLEQFSAEGESRAALLAGLEDVLFEQLAAIGELVNVRPN